MGQLRGRGSVDRGINLLRLFPQLEFAKSLLAVSLQLRQKPPHTQIVVRARVADNYNLDREENVFVLPRAVAVEETQELADCVLPGVEEEGSREGHGSRCRKVTAESKRGVVAADVGGGEVDQLGSDVAKLAGRSSA
jgi:hypothetical protein